MIAFLTVVLFCTASLPGTSPDLSWQISPGSVIVKGASPKKCSTEQFPGAVNKMVITETGVVIVPLGVEPPK